MMTLFAKHPVCVNGCNGCKVLCCCGEYLDGHGGHEGHTPVPMHEWYCHGDETDED